MSNVKDCEKGSQTRLDRMKMSIHTHSEINGLQHRAAILLTHSMHSVALYIPVQVAHPVGSGACSVVLLTVYHLHGMELSIWRRV
jgi:hypothetical protein